MTFAINEKILVLLIVSEVFWNIIIDKVGFKSIIKR